MKGRMFACTGFLILAGCVSSVSYGDLKAKHDHLLSVKEQWESEQQAIEERVENTTRAYHQVSVEQGNLKAQNDQVLTAVRVVKDDVRNTNAKVDRQMDRQEANLRAHEERMAQMEGRFTELMAKVTTMAETNHALTGRVDQLLTKMTKGLQANGSSTDAPKMKASVALSKKAVAAKMHDTSTPKSPAPTGATGSSAVSEGSVRGSEKLQGETPAVSSVAAGPSVQASSAVEKAMQQGSPLVKASVGPVPASELTAEKKGDASVASTPSKDRSSWRELLDKLRPSFAKPPESPKPSTVWNAPAGKPAREGLGQKTDGQAFATPPTGALTISGTPGVVVPEVSESKDVLPPTK